MKKIYYVLDLKSIWKIFVKKYKKGFACKIEIFGEKNVDKNLSI